MKSGWRSGLREQVRQEDVGSGDLCTYHSRMEPYHSRMEPVEHGRVLRWQCRGLISGVKACLEGIYVRKACTWY